MLHVRDARASGPEAARDTLPPVSTGPVELAVAAPKGLLPGAQPLARARTLRELSHLVGDAPDGCRMGIGAQSCTWTLSRRETSYPLLRVPPAVEGPVELRCVLPLDASPREPNSCSVSWTD